MSSLAGYETTAQAAARLGVGYRHIWRLAAAGRVEGAQLLTVGSRADRYAGDWQRTAVLVTDYDAAREAVASGEGR